MHSFVACGLSLLCPQTLAEAEAMTLDDELVAGGHAIRYIPSPDDAAFRGYDMNVTVPISDGAELNTSLLSVDAPILGILDGMPALLLGERTDRHFVVVRVWLQLAVPEPT
jgi:hypothetical protein